MMAEGGVERILTTEVNAIRREIANYGEKAELLYFLNFYMLYLYMLYLILSVFFFNSYQLFKYDGLP
jgi:hypothetical protein